MAGLEEGGNVTLFRFIWVKVVETQIFRQNAPNSLRSIGKVFFDPAEIIDGINHLARKAQVYSLGVYRWPSLFWFFGIIY